MKIFVSREDEDLLSMKWTIGSASKSSENPLFYAGRVGVIDGVRRKVRMHRVIMERVLGRPLGSRELIDHIDWNGLNNRRENLRIATPGQNVSNGRLRRNNKSGLRGVSFNKQAHGWRAQICFDRKVIYIGTYKTERDALIAHDAVSHLLRKNFHIVQSAIAEH